MKNSIVKGIVVGFIGGAFASWVKAKVEPPLQDLGEKMFPPSDTKLALKGADVTNQPEKMPPAVLAGKVYKFYAEEELSDDEKVKCLPYIHYGMGLFIGAVYTLVVNRKEELAFDGGLTAGAFIWSTTHGSVLPSLGLQGEVKEMPNSWWVWEFGSHIVFGVAMEQSRVILNKLIK